MSYCFGNPVMFDPDNHSNSYLAHRERSRWAGAYRVHRARLFTDTTNLVNCRQLLGGPSRLAVQGSMEIEASKYHSIAVDPD